MSIEERIVEEGGKAEQVVEGKEWVEERRKNESGGMERGGGREGRDTGREVRRPFDMERGPMVRAQLIREGRGKGNW